MKDLSEYPCGNCEQCPRVSALRDGAEELRINAERIGTAALGEETDEAAAAILNFFAGESDTVYMSTEEGEMTQIQAPEDVARVLRSGTTSILEGMDARREDLKLDIAEMSEHCPGPLKMRAEKAGQLVTVTVCMSPSAEKGQAEERVIVLREVPGRR